MSGQIIINEFMPAPTSDDQEWIEIINTGNDLQVDTLKVADNLSSKFITNIELKSNVYYLIAKDTNLLKNKYKYLNSLPHNQVRFIELSFPILNNTTDEIKIYYSSKVNNITNKLSDSVYYDMKNGVSGKSFERINPNININEIGNLLISNDKLNATPGKINSNTKLDYDIKNNWANQSDNIIYINYSNFGNKLIEEYKIKILLNKLNSNIEKQVILDTISQKLEENQTKEFQIDIENFIKKFNIGDELVFDVITENNKDNRKENDSLIINYTVPYPPNSLIITEFCTNVNSYDTNTVKSNIDSVENQKLILENRIMGEFVEIYNNYETEINLNGYRFEKLITKDKKSGILINQDLFIKPKEYELIVWDSAFFVSFPSVRLSNSIFFIQKPSFNLNSTSDIFYLIDRSDNVIDSVIYSDKMHSGLFKNKKNISLEKINNIIINNDFNQNNWSSCLDINGATPLKPNSIIFTNSTDNILEISPNPFAPTNSNNKFDECKITYSLVEGSYIISAFIFDLYGNKVKTLVDNKALPKNYELIWDGKDDNGNFLSIGAYVVLIEAVNYNSNEIQQLKKVLVLGN